MADEVDVLVVPDLVDSFNVPLAEACGVELGVGETDAETSGVGVGVTEAV